MLKKAPKTKAVTPQAESVASAVVPDRPASLGVDRFLTPRRFQFGSSEAPIELEDDERSEALSDLTNTQLSKKQAPKRPRKRIFHEAESEGAVLGEEGFETEEDSLAMSPNLLE
jgi:hypothetical protein